MSEQWPHEREQNDVIETDDGQVYYTGLWLPEERPRVMARYVDSVFPLLEWDVIKALATDPEYYAGRKRFGSDYIRNQGSRGSCNGYAGAKATQRAREIRGQERLDLSGEDAYAQINGGRDRGSSLGRGMRALWQTGVAPENMVPHQEYLEREISSQAKQARKRNRILEPLGVDTYQELCSGLVMGMIGVVAVHASNRWSRIDSNGVCGESHGVGNHSVGVDGVHYIGGQPVVDMFNSWGTRWGTDGRGYCNWDLHFSRTINNHDFYLIPTTVDDTEDEGAEPPVPDGQQDQDDVPTSDVLLEVQSSPSCSPCVRWHREEKPKAQAAGWMIQQKTPEGRVPQFTIRKGGRSFVFEPRYRTFEELKQRADQL